MKKVRFLEGCYMFSTRKSYDPNTITYIESDQAIRLSKRGVVDILEDEEYLKEEEIKEDNKELESLKVDELKEIAKKHEVDCTGLRKAEIIERLNEVL